MNMITEPVSAVNIDAFVALALDLWPDASFKEERDEYKDMLQAGGQAGFLAKSANQYVGFVHVTLRHDYVEGADNAPTAYVEGLFVRPAYRAKGIAHMLLDAAAAWARQKGCTQLASDTELTNTDSIAFHKSAGFTEVNRIVCFIREL